MLKRVSAQLTAAKANGKSRNLLPRACASVSSQPEVRVTAHFRCFIFIIAGQASVSGDGGAHVLALSNGARRCFPGARTPLTVRPAPVLVAAAAAAAQARVVVLPCNGQANGRTEGKRVCVSEQTYKQTTTPVVRPKSSS
jgi:hypothetical protein